MSRRDSATHLGGVFEADEMHNSLVPEAERREVNHFASNPAFISEEEAPSQHTHGDRLRGDFNARRRSDLVQASNLVVQLPPPAHSRNFFCDPEPSTSSAMDRPSHLHYFLTKAPSLVDMTRFDLISLNKPLFESLTQSSNNSSSLLEPPQAAGPSNEDLVKSFLSTEKDFNDQSIRTDVTSMASSDLQTSSSEDDDVVSPDVIPRFVRPSMRRIKRIRLPLAVDETPDEPLPPPINFATSNDEINSTMTTDLEDSFLDSSSIIEDDVLRRNVLDSSIESNLSSASTVQYSETSRVPELPTNTAGDRRNTSSTEYSTEDVPYFPSISPSSLGQWPFQFCFSLASFGCVIGLYNLSRFAVLSAQFGGSFIVQFFILSIFFGIPLFLFHVALGHYLGAGVINMWRISPVFQGVGIALLIGQAFIGFYGIIGVSWLLVYLRDSFIRGGDSYSWAFTFSPHRDYYKNRVPGKLEETVSDYFNGVALKRFNLYSSDRSFGHFKFSSVFNLAIVWILVFATLSKGVKSYSKALTGLVLLSVCGLIVISSEMFYLASKFGHSALAETTWDDIFYNGQSWIAAATETFLTWGILGAATMQAASHVSERHHILRQSLVTIVAVITALAFVACVADACIQILQGSGYQYEHTSSFELMSSTQFMRPVDQPTFDMSTRYLPHSSLMVGNRVIIPAVGTKNKNSRSGYQAIRLVTELLPATFATLGVKQMSPCWAVMAFLTLIFFGILQQLAVWHSVISGIISISSKNLKPWRTTIAFFTCIFACVLGLPLTTELGIWIVYFLDTVVGNGWWLALLHCLLIIAVIVVRGHPYNGEVLANILFGEHCTMKKWLSPVLAFIWSVALPVYLLGITVLLFFSSESSRLYDWNIAKQNHYWEVWARELGSCLQLMPILLVPLVAIVQTCRYLSKGPSDLFERIELLYRPPPERPQNQNNNVENFVAGTQETNENTDVLYDPPPKYTPPPSYSTATGARIANFVRQSFRRSMRRIAAASIFQSANQTEELPRPPEYTPSVTIELHHSAEVPTAPQQISPSAVDGGDIPAELLAQSYGERSQTLPSRGKQLTAPQVAKILRGSFRRSQRYRNHTTLPQWIRQDDKPDQQTDENNTS